MPIMEMKVNMTPEGGGFEHRIMGTQWVHRKTVDGTAALTLASNYISLEYGPGDYSTFDAFFSEFAFLITTLSDDFGTSEVDRIGLRYINEIRLPGRALDWDGIIRDELVAAIKAPAVANGRLLRSMHQVIEQHGDDQVILNYGIFNPDYPAPVVQRFFILDVDCNRQGLIQTTEALACVRQLNVLATEAFESNIDDGLRKFMEVVQ